MANGYTQYDPHCLIMILNILKRTECPRTFTLTRAN